MSARIRGGSTYPDLPGCVHCGEPVKATNYALGPVVEHYDPAASFPTLRKGTAWTICRHGTVATMPGASEETTP